MENITIKENIDVPIIQKLIHLHNKEANVKTFIASIFNKYDEKINEAIRRSLKKKSKKMLSHEQSIQPTSAEKTATDKMKEIVKSNKEANRALFSEDIAQKVLNHKSNYKMED